MIVDLKKYAGMIGLSSPDAVRKRISRANGYWQNADLPGVISAVKMGNSWVFTVDQKKVGRNGKINLVDTKA